MATLAQRNHAHALMQLLLAHEPQVHYPTGDVRTGLDLATYKLTEQQLETTLAHGGKVTADCSELATELCRWVGLADPNGLHYAYPGTTWTMLAHLPHYTDPKIAKIGGLVIFENPAHVAVVMTPDPVKGNPMLFSHGSDRGPVAVTLEDERRYHPGAITLLSITHL